MYSDRMEGHAMMIKTAASWALAVVLGSTLLLTSAGQASAKGWLDRLQTKLELTDDQMKAFRELHDRDAGKQRQFFRALHQAQVDLRRLALNNADPAVIQQKTAEVEGLLAQGVQLRVQRLQEIAPLLTQEQRDRLAQLPPGPGMWRAPHGNPGPRS
jgi:Spy/CpxP family protein refolding chaperone